MGFVGLHGICGFAWDLWICWSGCCPVVASRTLLINPVYLIVDSAERGCCPVVAS